MAATTSSSNVQREFHRDSGPTTVTSLQGACEGPHSMKASRDRGDPRDRQTQCWCLLMVPPSSTGEVMVRQRDKMGTAGSPPAPVPCKHPVGSEVGQPQQDRTAPAPISYWQCQGKGASPPGSTKNELPHKFKGIFSSALEFAGDTQRQLMERFKPFRAKPADPVKSPVPSVTGYWLKPSVPLGTAANPL